MTTTLNIYDRHQVKNTTKRLYFVRFMKLEYFQMSHMKTIEA